MILLEMGMGTLKSFQSPMASNYGIILQSKRTGWWKNPTRSLSFPFPNRLKMACKWRVTTLTTENNWDDPPSRHGNSRDHYTSKNLSACPWNFVQNSAWETTVYNTYLSFRDWDPANFQRLSAISFKEGKICNKKTSPEILRPNFPAIWICDGLMFGKSSPTKIFSQVPFVKHGDE